MSSPAGGLHPGGFGDGQRDHRGLHPPRCGGGYPGGAGGCAKAVRRRCGRGDQAEQNPLFHQGGAAGGECAQDAAGHGAGHPGHHHQAGRSAAQHAHHRRPAAAEAAGQGQGNHGHFRPAGPPAGHPRRQGGAGRFVPAHPGWGGLPGDRGRPRPAGGGAQ